MTSGENAVYPKTNMACYMLGGTKGALSVPDMQLWQHPAKRSWWEPIESQTLAHASADPVEQQLLHFIELIAGRTKPLVTAQEGLKNIQVLDAIKEAARSKLRQKV
jgi:predicted dehydrogenase